MDGITDYERRISAALERIGNGIDGLGAGAPAAAGATVAETGDDAAARASLHEELDAERAANAQLTERVRAIKEKQETVIGGLEKNVSRLTQQLDVAGRELQRQKRIIAQLNETNRTLRDAAQSGVSEPHLINKSMMTELETLRAARAAEMAEMDEILSELKPLIGEVA
jgi:chromosome segregation ATPase